MDRKNDSWWHYAQVTSKWSFIDVKNDEHTPKNGDSVIETIPWIGHLLMKNDEYTPKNGDFNKKNDEVIL